MKLLIVYHAGLSQDSRAIFREYAKQGIDLTVIVPTKSKTQTGSPLNYNKSDEEKTFKFVPLEFKTGFKFHQLFWSIKQVNPDVIHVLDEYSSIYLLQTIFCKNILFGRKVPVLAFVFQNIPFKSPPFIFEFSIKFFKRIFYKIVYWLIFYYHNKNIAGIAGGNTEALLNVKALNKNAPLKLIFWGVDLKKFYPKSRAECRKRFGISENTKLFGYFGRIIKLRGVDKLIKAVKSLDCSLMIVGDGEYRSYLEKLIESLGIKNKIYWLDDVNQEELVDYYNCLDCFVFPSETTKDCKEQYGRVLVEAMSCQIPVIGSDSGAIPEVLRGYPKGLIFKEGDADGLANKMAEIGDLKFPEDFDLQKFLYKFSVENFVSENIKFYKESLK
jgi:glycosyltransferase involved in cell wall biosynthesis